jgi:hypothetical protein
MSQDVPLEPFPAAISVDRLALEEGPSAGQRLDLNFPRECVKRLTRVDRQNAENGVA